MASEGPFVVSNRTRLAVPVESIPDGYKRSEVAEAITAYETENRTEHSVSENFWGDDPTYEVDPVKTNLNADGKDIDDWISFSKQYPGAKALITFSAVGFNQDHSIAAVSFSITSGQFESHHHILFMFRNENGSWEGPTGFEKY